MQRGFGQEPNSRKYRFVFVKRSHSSPTTAGIASSVLPGLGQILVGSVASGWILLISSISAIIGAIYMTTSANQVELLEMVTDPKLILILLGINLTFGLIRVLAAVDAWKRAGGKVIGLGIVSLAAFTLVPHIAVGYVGLEARTTILKVFPSSQPVAIAIATTTTLPATTTATTFPDIPVIAAWTLPAKPTTTTTTTLPLGTNRLTVLLMGSDAGPGRAGLRTDSMMVVSVDTLTGDAAIFGLPRDMGGFMFSDGTEFPGLGSGLLNEVYMWGQRNPEGFDGPDTGISALKDVVETLLGVPIDHYVLVDMIGFVELVDSMGGVTVKNPAPFAAPLYDTETGEYEMINFDSGVQRLDGDLALAYSRSRTGSNDYTRMARQRCVISALVGEASPGSMLTRLPHLLNVMEEYLVTDIPYNDLPYLINFAPRISGERTTVVGFDIGYRSGEVTAAGLPEPDVAKIQAAVTEVFEGSWDDGSISLPPASDVCQ